MEIEKLKSMAYDLIAQKEMIMQRLSQINTEIMKLTREEQEKQQKEMIKRKNKDAKK
ncbi:MAG: hypothetical protein ACTSUC_09985 [Promethearchaeota archaeon]